MSEGEVFVFDVRICQSYLMTIALTIRQPVTVGWEFYCLVGCCQSSPRRGEGTFFQQQQSVSQLDIIVTMIVQCDWTRWLYGDWWRVEGRWWESQTAAAPTIVTVIIYCGSSLAQDKILICLLSAVCCVLCALLLYCFTNIIFKTNPHNLSHPSWWGVDTARTNISPCNKSRLTSLLPSLSTFLTIKIRRIK